MLPNFAYMLSDDMDKKKVCMDHLSKLDQNICMFNDNIEEGPIHTSGTHSENDYLVHS